MKRITFLLIKIPLRSRNILELIMKYTTQNWVPNLGWYSKNKNESCQNLQIIYAHTEKLSYKADI